MQLWLTVLAVGIFTYLQRVSFIATDEGLPLSSRFRRGLRFVPISVLAALIVPELLLVDGTFSMALTNSRLLAGSVAVALAWRSRSILWTLLGGMGVLLLAEWLLSAIG
jgi:branched-subunit amino acid transport protein